MCVGRNARQGGYFTQESWHYRESDSGAAASWLIEQVQVNRQLSGKVRCSMYGELDSCKLFRRMLYDGTTRPSAATTSTAHAMRGQRLHCELVRQGPGIECDGSTN